MKAKIVLITTFLILTTFLPALAQAKDVTIYVKGMVCGFCAQGIEKKFKALREIKSVHVSLEEKQVHLNVDDSMELSDTKINELISQAGYNIEKIERAPK